MHPNPKRIIPLVFVVALAVAAYYALPAFLPNRQMIISGSIEATEVRLGSEFGGRVTSIMVQEGDGVESGQPLAEVHLNSSARTSGAARERITSPLSGVVLYRSVEPGEVVAVGAPLITVADLTDLELTVYVPEDRYGQIRLGQTHPVTVDSFPTETFTGTVVHIADRAEFTPRNVQTTEGRKTTVFAVRLSLGDGQGKLKPGMPADVHFEEVESEK
jgi:HlyD family secretion protein